MATEGQLETFIIKNETSSVNDPPETVGESITNEEIDDLQRKFYDSESSCENHEMHETEVTNSQEAIVIVKKEPGIVLEAAQDQTSITVKSEHEIDIEPTKIQEPIDIKQESEIVHKGLESQELVATDEENVAGKDSTTAKKSQSLSETATCLTCKKSYANQVALDRHIRNIHSERSRFPCKQCDNDYANRAALKYHYEMHHGEDSNREVQCEVCNKTVANKLKLIRHKQIAHRQPTTLFRCDRCDKTFRAKYKLDDHYACQHLGQHRYACEFCKNPFYSMGAYIFHRKNKHPKEYAALSEKHGGKVPINMFDQTTVPQEKHPLVNCKFCSEKATSNLKLKQHLREKHKDKMIYGCIKCDKMYFGWYQLVDHYASEHVGKPRYGCDFCEKKFFYSVDYYKHRKSQHPKEFAALKEKCGDGPIPVNTLYTVDELPRKWEFSKGNQGEKRTKKKAAAGDEVRQRFQCELCGKHFFYPSAYYKHRKVAHPEEYAARKQKIAKVYVCEICEKQYARQASLDAHFATCHIQETSDICEYCGEHFYTRTKYLYHRNMVHPEKKSSRKRV